MPATTAAIARGFESAPSRSFQGNLEWQEPTPSRVVDRAVLRAENRGACRLLLGVAGRRAEWWSWAGKGRLCRPVWSLGEGRSGGFASGGSCE